ncbi:Superkiller protein 3 [Neolecta irregularis DAH-3]|uniref:Superkiller protein 3 n=1 Tax=Neolecta irregularis (strain DAH-3) TaxID=1198029 RepID=A0A1U7LHI9_NEOID|nr:Superkiller protein 3 [Neolecta irregularis DAH-3]|eukprot:OLL22126.1 Superkiller protein 3 [Neolecta irregularis DAH-3]
MGVSKKLAEIFMNKYSSIIANTSNERDDKDKCFAVIDKTCNISNKYGNEDLQLGALVTKSPESPFFVYLEDRLPHPSITYAAIIDISEKNEKDTMNKEIAKRRSRLGARMEDVVKDVTREILLKSKLDNLYQNLVNWSYDETVRREVEEKILERGYRLLNSLPSAMKGEQCLKVQEWAKGLVILKAPVELAWLIYLDWKDIERIGLLNGRGFFSNIRGDLDKNILHDFSDLFPKHPLTRILATLYRSNLNPFPRATTDSEDSTPKDAPLLVEDIVDDVMNELQSCSQYILAYRILSDMLSHIRDYQSISETCKDALDLLNKRTVDTGHQSLLTYSHFETLLGTAYVYFNAPKLHAQAEACFDRVLARHPRNQTALVGKGLVLEERAQFHQALEYFEKVLDQNRDYVHALAEFSWCQIMLGAHEQGKSGLERCLELLHGEDLQCKELRAEVWWRMGYSVWENQPELRSDRALAYDMFITSLKQNPNFAPVYTSLGIFFAEIKDDHDRASKCFQKAFELDAGEIEAAERLARSFSDSNEWELVEIVARRVSSAPKKRLYGAKMGAWPERALGIVELNQHNYHIAIRFFQSALRINPSDFHSWIGLGEAYFYSGRHIAAQKSLLQAESLEGTFWFATYLRGLVSAELGEFEIAIDCFLGVLSLDSENVPARIALANTYIEGAHRWISKAHYALAAENAHNALTSLSSIVLQDPQDNTEPWKILGEALGILGQTIKFIKQDIMEIVEHLAFRISGLLSQTCAFEEDFDPFRIDAIESFLLKEKDSLAMTCLGLSVYVYKVAVHISYKDRLNHSIAWYNLGLGEYKIYQYSLNTVNPKSIDAAIYCFKKAIKLESRNCLFWNSLAVVTSEKNPRVSQHAFLRALQIDDKNAKVWSNLGCLYLIHNDLEISEQVFVKARSMDPDIPAPWIGCAFISLLSGDIDDATSAFQHAVSLADSTQETANLYFAALSFDTIIDGNTDLQFVNPIFALQKCLDSRPDSIDALDLQALLLERTREYPQARANLESLCQILEGEYEDTESETTLKRFVIGKANLSRVCLAQKVYKETVEHCKIALALSEGTSDMAKARLSCYITSGLGLFYLERFQESLDMFEVALEETKHDPDISVLVAKVLWAMGEGETRRLAAQQLLQCIEKHPGHVTSIILLGLMGYFLEDEELQQAVLSEIESLDFSAKRKMDPDYHVESVQSLLASKNGQDLLSHWRRSIFIQPSSSKAWRNFGRWAECNDFGQVVLELAKKDINDVNALTRAYREEGSMSNLQTATMIAPWSTEATCEMYNLIE